MAITPDSTQALSEYVEREFASDQRSDLFLYSAIALAGIGTSQRDRHVAMAAHAIRSLDPQQRAVVLDEYNVPAEIHRAIASPPAVPAPAAGPSIVPMRVRSLGDVRRDAEIQVRHRAASEIQASLGGYSSIEEIQARVEDAEKIIRSIQDDGFVNEGDFRQLAVEARTQGINIETIARQVIESQTRHADTIERVNRRVQQQLQAIASAESHSDIERALNPAP